MPLDSVFAGAGVLGAAACAAAGHEVTVATGAPFLGRLPWPTVPGIAPGVELVNADLASEIEPLARRSTPEQTVHALDAILRARTALEGNVAPLLALEALLIDLQFARRA